MRSLRFTAAVVLAGAFAVSACDSASEQPITSEQPQTPNDPALRLASPFPDLTVEASRDVTIDVATRFDYGAGTPPTFAAEALGSAVTVFLDGPLLTLQAMGPGSSAVAVTARGGSGQTVTDTFSVKTRSDCPWGGRDGESDFLPLESGDIWTFDYAATSWQVFSPSTSESGRLSLSLVSAWCANGQRTVNEVERRQGMRRSVYTRADGVVVRDTVEFDETENVSITETSEGVKLPWSAGGIPRYHDASVDTVRVGAGPYGPVCGPGAAVAALALGGLASFEASCNHSSSGRSIQLTRVWGAGRIGNRSVPTREQRGQKVLSITG